MSPHCALHPSVPRGESDSDRELRYFCSPEWHLAQLKRTPMAGIIYSFALRICKETRLFHGSVVGLAEYFGGSRAKVQRAIKALVVLGFFELVSRRRFGSSLYRVLSHKQWAEKHPGLCPVKKSAESDPLKETLLALSGGWAHFPPAALYWLRGQFMSDCELEGAFKEFLDREPQPQDGRFIVANFRRWVEREQERAARECP